MFFYLRSEIESMDPIKNYLVKRIKCPSCGKMQLKKICTIDYYSKYLCWNKHCKSKEEPFLIINDYLKNEVNFEDRCEACYNKLYRDFIEIIGIYGKLIFKCVDDKCPESNFELSYDFENQQWIKRDILSNCEFQYIH